MYLSQKLHTNSRFANLRAISDLFSFFLIHSVEQRNQETQNKITKILNSLLWIRQAQVPEYDSIDDLYLLLDYDGL